MHREKVVVMTKTHYDQVMFIMFLHTHKENRLKRGFSEFCT